MAPNVDPFERFYFSLLSMLRPVGFHYSKEAVTGYVRSGHSRCGSSIFRTSLTTFLYATSILNLGQIYLFL